MKVTQIVLIQIVHAKPFFDPHIPQNGPKLSKSLFFCTLTTNACISGNMGAENWN